MQITDISAFQVFDSRGRPTIEVDLTLSNGIHGRGLVPAGASTGQFEALELRDGDASRYRGRSVYKAIDHVQGEIARALRGCDVFMQRELDSKLIALDGTENKSRLGANAILGVSLAAVDAAARCRNQMPCEYLNDGTPMTLPLPEIQIMGGGAHANHAIDIQDIMVMAVGASSYEQTLEITHNIYHATAELLASRNLLTGIADEGGFWPSARTNQAALDICMEGIERAGYTPGVEVALSLDIAASDFYDPGKGVYEFRCEGRSFDAAAFCELMADWCARYPIAALEDPAADTDTKGWDMICSELGARVTLIGDDLFVTNVARIKKGINEKIANAVLIKLNQIGTVTETIDAIELTRKAGWLPVISARSGETEDAFIAHLAVATGSPILKVGSFARSERMVKWNEVLRISRRLGAKASFRGAAMMPWHTAGPQRARQARP
ncbi:MAG: phosphopyruvate hydratase [Phycisphaerales bacterium]|nr:phosphopyruvate hydratase [Phycisphaerales bacterium]